MTLQLRPLFMGEIDRMAIDGQLDLSSFEFHGARPLTSPVTIRGEIVMRAGLAVMTAVLSYEYEGVCDRCLADVRRPMTTKMDHILVSELSGEETDELVLCENEELPLEPLAEADIFLALPQKILCKSDCRGLCQHCGKNLNDGLCGCRNDAGDPRLAVLAALLEDEAE
ncbi:MAG: DUF177 domain-containing protein [Clostridia bacterium]|nr:DUF177 domain-containing protein [Clostridia bacterium]